MAWYNSEAGGAALGAALGGVPGAAAGAALGGNWGGSGDAFTDMWRGTGLWQDKKYAPYQPDNASFQDPRLEEALAGYQQNIAGAPGRAPAAWYQGRNQDLASALWAQSQGQGPSIAQQQFNQATQQSLAAQQAAAASASTAANPALAQRSLAQQQAGMNQAAAGQSGLLRLQEQMQARGQLANVLGQGAGMAFQNQGANDAMVQFYEQLAAGREEANRQAQIEKERIAAGAYGSAQGYQYGQNQGNQGMAGNLLGGILGGGSAVGAALASDERQKKDLVQSNVIQPFLDALAAKDFQYKDPSIPGAAPGPQTGVLAQDLAATPLGAQTVRQTPTGMKIDVEQGLGAALAGLAQVNDRLNAIDGGAQTDPSGLPLQGQPGRPVTDMEWARYKFPNDPEAQRRFLEESARQRAMEQAGPKAGTQPSRGGAVLERLRQLLGTQSGGGGSAVGAGVT